MTILSKRFRQESILLNWMDIDWYLGEEGTTVRIYGVDEQGDSISIHVTGFRPYFYSDIPLSKFDEAECFKRTLNLKEFENMNVYSKMYQQKKAQDMGEESVIKVEVVDRQSVMGYTKVPSRKMLKITVSNPNVLATIRNLMENTYQVQTYESRIDFRLRFMIDKGIVGCNWLELPGNKYWDRNKQDMHTKRDVVISHKDLVSYGTQTHSRIGKYKVCSFDIECQGRKGHFPDPELDPVIQIANTVYVCGDKPTDFKQTIFVLGTCAEISNAKVYSFKTEREMMLAWRAFVIQTDPDVFTGYNIQNFDFPYLLNRASTLGISQRFNQLGRIKANLAEMTTSTFQSSAYGKRESVDTKIDGRIMVDMIQYFYRNHKMTSYSLNSVSAEFLSQQKEDVHHSEISKLQNGDELSRRRLAVYCLKDSLLPLSLMLKLLVLVNYVEMARVTGVPMTFLFTRGQQIKVISMLYRKAQSLGMVVPSFPRTNEQNEDDVDDDTDSDSSSSSEDEDEEEEEQTKKGKGSRVPVKKNTKEKKKKKKKASNKTVSYEGATVLEPIRAFYQKPIATLDFASLYPSIMRAHNLCYSTLLTPEQAAEMNSEDVEKSPCGHWFVREHVRKGILPMILTELLDARGQAKKDMKVAKTEFERDVMNGRQLALKVSANSVYGFTGATIGALPCIPISSSVTAYGREMILATKKAVEENYTIEKGHQANAQVVYGDTDSVMVNFGVATVEEALKLGKEAAKQITKIFPQPVSLEFEKVYFPYLLMNKKRYAGLYWTKPDKYDKLDCKGIETVRRDNCQLVRTVLNTCLRKIIIEQKVQEAVDYVKEQISLLLQNKIDLSMLIITKSLSRDASEYKSKQPHVELAAKMRQRDPGSAPVTGDRVPYVIIETAKKLVTKRKSKPMPMSMKSEDPSYVLENSVPIDTNYYLEKQLSKPLMRLFECILPDPSVLLRGDHTRHIFKATPSAQVGIMRFASRGRKCLGCKIPITNPDPQRESSAICCSGCAPQKQNIYVRQVNAMQVLENRFSRLWTQCQRCQGSVIKDVLCQSKDCPIFFMRQKVQKDMNETQALLDLF